MVVTIGEERARPDIPVHAVVVAAMVAFVAWIVLAALTVALGALVTHYVVGHALGRADAEAARWFADRRTDTWNVLSHVGSYLAETVTVFVVLAISVGVLAARRAWAQCGLLMVTMAAEGGVYLVATYFVSRNRPAVPRLEHLIVTDSFPSGHTAAATAMYGALCIVVWSLTQTRVWRDLFLLLAIVGPLVVATSRVYRGMHNPTDVASGVLIGAGCIVVGLVAVRAGWASVGEEAPTDARLDHSVEWVAR